MLCHHPRNTIVLKGNWDTLGLRGTGSYDYTLTDGEIFVPAHMTYKFNGGTPERGGMQYSAGLVTITTWGHTVMGARRRPPHARRTREAGAHAASTHSARCATARPSSRNSRKPRQNIAPRGRFVYDSWESVDEAYAQGRPGNRAGTDDGPLAMRICTT